MLVLAIDTALDACQAALTRDGEVLGACSEPMTRGHQERLAPLVHDLMAEAGLAFTDLDRIGVTVGPGSFTGLRVGLAFAKGLSLALGVPCVGVGTLEALAGSQPAGLTAAVVDARRERVHLQLFEDGVSLGTPEHLAIADALIRVDVTSAGGPVRLAGPGAALLAGAAGAELVVVAAPDPVVVARLTGSVSEPSGRPSPLYLREPDARTIAERLAAASA